jgi:hypothetical protein
VRSSDAVAIEAIAATPIKANEFMNCLAIRIVPY